MPIGWIGLMVARLTAAISSTILTHLNWGASYLVHDFYRRFITKDAAEKHYVFVGRLATLQSRWRTNMTMTSRQRVLETIAHREPDRVPFNLRVVAEQLDTVEHLRSVRGDVKIAFHSCGHVTPLVGDLIEVGIDVLEGVQAECMDIAYLKREFGRDIAFWGGVGAQSVLARSTPEQVIEGVRRTLTIMAPGGGYIAAPCHTLTEEVPWANIAAFHQAVTQFGAYPNPGE